MSGSTRSEHPPLSPPSVRLPDLWELKPSPPTHWMCTFTWLSYSTLCVTVSWLFHESLAQKMKVEVTIVHSWKFPKNYWNDHSIVQLFNRKHRLTIYSPRFFEPLLLPLVAINLKLVIHDPYPILIKPLIERASETRLQNLVGLPILPSPLQDTTKTPSYWEKNELSLVLTTGCPGAIWRKGSIQWKSYLSSQPSPSSGTHSDFRKGDMG